MMINAMPRERQAMNPGPRTGSNMRKIHAAGLSIDQAMPKRMNADDTAAGSDI
jgi:hypothetical protein